MSLIDLPQPKIPAAYRPPPPTSAVPSAMEVRAQLAAARVREGLSAGNAELDDVLAQRASADPWLQQTRYTRAEHAEMDAEFIVDERIQELLSDDHELLMRRAIGWENGRRIVTVYLTEDQAEVRRMLTDAVGIDRLRFGVAQFDLEETQRTVRAIEDARDQLRTEGIKLSAWGARPSGEVRVDFMAADRTAAEQILHQRFGSIVRPEWKGGTSSHTLQPFEFGSWHATDGSLTVFYGLPHNGERFGTCHAFETDDAVVVSLQLLVPRGWRTAVGGFQPSNASVHLQRPLGRRSVIDDSANRARPHWSTIEGSADVRPN